MPKPRKPSGQSPRARPAQPSPPERHPGKTPEQAKSSFEDLKVRDAGNRR
jgi:hypothetical protein